MRITAAFVVLAFVLSCQNKGKPSGATEEEATEPPQMREYSELAGMMTSIHAYHAVLKDSILEEAHALPAFPLELQRLHTAEATDPREINGDYHVLADRYISAIDSLQRAPYAHRIATYNAAISTCVECHQSRCPGPIPRIRKLRIKDVRQSDA